MTRTRRLTEAHLSGENLDPAAYRRQLVNILNRVGRLKGDAISDTLALFGELRRQVVEVLADVTSESEQIYRQTLAQIDDAIGLFSRRYQIDMARLVAAGFDLGGELALQPVVAAGLLDNLNIGRGITQNQVEIIQAFSADLVQGLTADLRKRINGEVAGVFTGTQNPFQAATKIGRNLTDRNHFATMFHRARTIVVTEIGRAQALATQRSQEDLVQVIIDANDDTIVRKRWLNAHLPGARPTHLDAERRYTPGGSPGPIPIDEEFIVAGEKGLYPRDPSFSVGNSANCHCVSITVIDDLDPVGVGDDRESLDQSLSNAI